MASAGSSSATLLEMVGATFTVLPLDEELERLLDAEARARLAAGLKEDRPMRSFANAGGGATSCAMILGRLADGIARRMAAPS